MNPTTLKLRRTDKKIIILSTLTLMSCKIYAPGITFQNFSNKTVWASADSMQGVKQNFVKGAETKIVNIPGKTENYTFVKIDGTNIYPKGRQDYIATKGGKRRPYLMIEDSKIVYTTEGEPFDNPDNLIIKGDGTQYEMKEAILGIPKKTPSGKNSWTGKATKIGTATEPSKTVAPAQKPLALPAPVKKEEPKKPVTTIATTKPLPTAPVKKQEAKPLALPAPTKAPTKLSAKEQQELEAKKQTQKTQAPKPALKQEKVTQVLEQEKKLIEEQTKFLETRKTGQQKLQAKQKELEKVDPAEIEKQAQIKKQEEEMKKLEEQEMEMQRQMEELSK